MNSKSGFFIIIMLVIFVLTQVIIRCIGIDNISVQALAGLLVIGSALVIIGLFRDGKKGYGIKYNTAVAILAILVSLITGISFVLFKDYPDLADKYGGILIILMMCSLFIFALYVIIYRIIYESKHK